MSCAPKSEYSPRRDITALLHEGTERKPETIEQRKVATDDWT